MTWNKAGRMVDCGDCGEWYHEQCIDLRKEVFVSKKIKWTCPKCNISIIGHFTCPGDILPYRVGDTLVGGMTTAPV